MGNISSNTEAVASFENVTIGFFVTCIVDLLRPSVGFATLHLLKTAGFKVEVPASQACCGQPAYNSGNESSAISIARQVIFAFENFDYVVVPSGSCAGMVREHYPRLFSSDVHWLDRARNLASKTYELNEFLVDVARIDSIQHSINKTCTYHDSCSGLNELGIHKQPRELLSKLEGLELREMEEADECCGFGGLFCVKYPEISTRIVDRKVNNALSTGADMLLGGDLGCLMNIAGYLRRMGSSMKVFHVAEILAGMVDNPSIGEKDDHV